jgi:hypothetical protein
MRKETGIVLATVGASGVVMFFVTVGVVGPSATLLVSIALASVAVIGWLGRTPTRRPSYRAPAVALLATLVLMGTVLLVVLNNGADDWIGL